MKITKQQLIEMISHEVSNNTSVLLETPISSTTGTKMGELDDHPRDKDPDGYEGAMAKQSLYHMARQADQLHDMFMDDDNLEPWVQSKITKAADYVRAVFEKVTHEKDNPKGR